MVIWKHTQTRACVVRSSIWNNCRHQGLTLSCWLRFTISHHTHNALRPSESNTVHKFCRQDTWRHSGVLFIGFSQPIQSQCQCDALVIHSYKDVSYAMFNLPYALLEHWPCFTTVSQQGTSDSQLLIAIAFGPELLTLFICIPFHHVFSSFHPHTLHITTECSSVCVAMSPHIQHWPVFFWLLPCSLPMVVSLYRVSMIHI